MEGLVDSVMGRKFKASKFNILAKLAISRVSVLKNQRQVRFSIAKSDVIQLLHLGHQDRALLRVEHMVKEQNMMDVFVMIEEYCYLLIDRIIMLKKERECHDEVKEAIASLIYASSRCGEFPELQGLRRIFSSRFGKEFANRALELRNNCGVNPKIIQKLSTQRPTLDTRMKLLKDAASENGIILNLVEDAPLLALEEKSDDKQKQKKEENYKLALMKYNEEESAEGLNKRRDEKMSNSVKERKKYKDVGDAALEAFQSAAYAAEAARAAVQLSTSISLETHQHDHVL